jgi:hypothetical protein
MARVCLDWLAQVKCANFAEDEEAKKAEQAAKVAEEAKREAEKAAEAEAEAAKPAAADAQDQNGTVVGGADAPK